MDGERGERLAAVVTVPDHHFVGAAFQEAGDGGVDLAGQKLTEFRAGELGLVLTADTGDTFGVGDEEDGFRLRPRDGGEQETGGDPGAHTSGVHYLRHATTNVSSGGSGAGRARRGRAGPDG